MKFFNIKAFFIIFILVVEQGFSQDTIVYNNENLLINIASQSFILEEKNPTYTAFEVLNLPTTAFKKYHTSVLNFENTTATFWVKFHLHNLTQKELYLLLDNPEIQYLKVYILDKKGKMRKIESGALKPFMTRSLSTTPFSFALPQDVQTILFEAKTYTGFTFPLVVGAINPIIDTLHKTDLFNGAYIGIMLVMIFYNIFISFTTKSRTYFYYFIYISISAFMMMRFRGLGFDLFWRNIPSFNTGSNLFPCLTVMSSVLFSADFLQIKKYSIKMYYVFLILCVCACVVIVTDQFYIQPFSNIAFQTIGGLTAICLLGTAIYIYVKGNKTAKYYIIAWVSLLICTIILMLALNGLLPVNFFTINAFQIGSAIEAVLLSIALADRINVYKKEREAAQQVALMKTRENAHLIREQNLLLEQKVKERTAELELEKEKSENLLLNILPKTIAEELKINGRAKPHRHENVSVMFIDIKGFTQYSQNVSPEQLVEDIDFLFKGFDGIIKKYEVEKIKTIGDAYLCASGLPNGNDNHAQEILKAAAEILDFVQNTKKKQHFFDIRIGIHSGPVVAGVVGDSKFVYDIWGDTVNTAARMEQNSEAGKINISENTYLLVKNTGKFVYRGKINAKNKGEIDMYFWEKQI